MAVKKMGVLKWMVMLALLTCLIVCLCNVVIIAFTKDAIHNNLDGFTEQSVALLLGTSKYTANGDVNLFFKHRVETCAALYLSGKVKHIIVSGDNSLKEYNEPREMRKALIALGVPQAAITLDYAGFRTLDSVVRCKKVFGQDNIVVVSQRFHLQRALFIAENYGINALGFVAPDPPGTYPIRTQVREYFAKTKAIIDLYVLNKEPKFLGERIAIPVL